MGPTLACWRSSHLMLAPVQCFTTQRTKTFYITPHAWGDEKNKEEVEDGRRLSVPLMLVARRHIDGEKNETEEKLLNAIKWDNHVKEMSFSVYFTRGRSSSGDGGGDDGGISSCGRTCFLSTSFPSVLIRPWRVAPGVKINDIKKDIKGVRSSFK